MFVVYVTVCVYVCVLRVYVTDEGLYVCVLCMHVRDVCMLCTYVMYACKYVRYVMVSFYVVLLMYVVYVSFATYVMYVVGKLCKNVCILVSVYFISCLCVCVYGMHVRMFFYVCMYGVCVCDFVVYVYMCV